MKYLILEILFQIYAKNKIKFAFNNSIINTLILIKGKFHLAPNFQITCHFWGLDGF